MSGKPQFKLAAVRVGDLLKNVTTINEINRTATSVFAFNRESFPVEPDFVMINPDMGTRPE